ncbi:receptor-like protein 13 [Hibiscus syriacus]|uniref:receptor-like protein 13 n=1 Tax=Hibiscus syriacus TaxID=106335 RepID=UPI001921FCF7|nr:receptor-like protein 13 [Hibiscus syriacus]
MWVVFFLGGWWLFRCDGCWDDEKTALMQLKPYFSEYIDGVNKWGEGDGDCCKWERVECNNSTGRVIRLFLNIIDFRSVHGFFDDSMAEDAVLGWGEREQWYLDLSLFLPFQELNTLYLGRNSIAGFVHHQGEPTLPKLETLALSYNLFNTSIFSFLGVLSNLKSLGINHNQLEGAIHIKELNALSNLEELFMSGNKVTDFVPSQDSNCGLPLQSLALFPSLNTVRLTGFNVEGTIMASQNEYQNNFTNLEELSVGYSFLQTNILGSIGQFTSVKRLKLYKCEMNGSLNILEGLCEMTNLQQLSLNFNNFKSSLPECFSNLTSLRNLDLSRNQFSGNISVLESLTSLKTLYLSSNQFSGNIDALKSLTSLETLVLSSNQFSGNIDALKSLTSLETLELSSNQFSGNIDALKGLASLQDMWLSNNNFQIPVSLGPLFNLSKLKGLFADNNIMYGETHVPSSSPRFQLKAISLSCCGEAESFPEFLYHQHDLMSFHLSNIFFKGNQFPNWLLLNNTKLESIYLTNTSLSGSLELPLASHIHFSYLDVSNNFFNGSIPPEIGEQLPSLVFLNMSKNHFIGTIPSSLGHMTSLRVLDLSDNKLEGKIFSGNFKLPNLRVLKLNGNNFSERIPDLLSKSLLLLALDISNNKLSGRIPKWLGNMSSLQRIILSNNHLEGTIPIDFCQLDLIVLVDLSVNNISGSIPSCFNPSKIIQVHLAKNRLRGTLPDALRNSSTLVTLDIRENLLSGNIPSWIGGLSNLSYLLLSHNNLQGKIPMELCKLNHLSVIDLSHNNLSGQIPPCLNLTTLGDLDYVNARMIGSSIFSLNVPIDFSMKNGHKSYRGRIIPLVSGIDLSCNKLVGEIPPQIGHLHKILGLNLSHNSLTGPIPPAFANLRQIESVDLSNNKLSGNIPSQLVGLTFMSTFNVSFNNLSGRTPSRVAQFGTFDEFSYLGNPFLCGEPLPKCADTGSSPPKPNSSTDNDGEHGLIDMGAFRVTFIASYTVMLLVVPIVLYINPYWRRAWFYHVKTAATFCYYFVLDNVLPRRFYCRNL